MENPKHETHILVVDDTPKNVQLLGEILSKEGYKVHAAHNGDQALKRLEKIQPDLILLDVIMPQIDGFEVCRTLKSSPKTKDIPIIFLTAKTDKESIIKAFELGAVDYITKPFNVSELLARVGTHYQLQTGLKNEKQQALELKMALDAQQAISENLLLTSQELDVGKRRLEGLNNTKDLLLKQVSTLGNTYLKSLNKIIGDLQSAPPNAQDLIRQAAHEIHIINEMVSPIASLYLEEKATQDKKVLLAETNKRQQAIAKMALRGTKVELDIVSDMESGQQYLEEKNYDILFINSELIELSDFANRQTPNTQPVFMTSQDTPEYLSVLQQYPFLSNIISQNDEDRIFTLKNITTTVSKLATQNYFGLEKYLNWGVNVHHHSIESSKTRSHLVQKMEQDFSQLGIRRSLLSKCAMVAEELIMNAIYDAPTDTSGRAIYNHLPRTTTVDLKPEEQGVFHYACDGMLLAVAAEDPFGAFDRETILDYLESCYSGQAGSLNQKKGGAGRGIFEIMETADLVVFNVKPRIRTEVIAIFNISANKPNPHQTTSFHYFYG